MTSQNFANLLAQVYHRCGQPTTVSKTPAVPCWTVTADNWSNRTPSLYTLEKATVLLCKEHNVDASFVRFTHARGHVTAQLRPELETDSLATRSLWKRQKS